MPAYPKISGLLVFIAYILAGLVPLTPYLLLPHITAIPFSVGFALVGMTILGVIKGRVTKKSSLRSAGEVLIIGGIATAIGVTVGLIFKV